MRKPKEIIDKFLNKRIVPTPLTLQSLFNYSVAHCAHLPSIAFVGSEPLTYAELGKKVDNIAGMLFAAGLRQGDKVAILSHNMPNWVIAYFAIVSSGLVAVPVLPDFSRHEVQGVLRHSETKALFISEKQIPKIKNSHFPNIEYSVKLDDFSVLKASTVATLTDSYVQPTINEDDLAALIYTSGTTGRSKGVMLTHKNITWNAAQCAQFHQIDSSDVFLSFLPLSHTYENTIGMIYPIMYGASIFYLEKPPTPAALLPALEKVRPTLMCSVPLIMEKIYKSQVQGKFTKNNIIRSIYKTPFFRVIIHRIAGKKLYKIFGGRLKFFGIGGSKLDSRVERFLAEAKFPYAIGYGLTETSPLIAGAGVGKTRLQSTGIVLQGVDIKIVDKNKKGVGELWTKGPNVMQGYYKNPELTAEVLTEDGWLKTGDLAYLSSKGLIFIKGRSKNTIIGANGENIYPEDIESVINNQEFVLESLVIEENGLLVAKVLPNLEELEKHIANFKANYENSIERYHIWKENIKREINMRLSKFSQIKRIDIVEQPFEKTASLKIKRFLYTKSKSASKQKS
ncbi:MAG: AMP-binding protein [Prevotellaceae bacterium]|jgi:long-chain acyl-CoA synthetase|nr:AMP-binding protein [Prevotellaceae bacterium]